MSKINDVYQDRAELIADLEKVEIHPVLAAAAAASGNVSLLDHRYAPSTPTVTATTLANGGLEKDVLREVREKVADVLLALDGLPTAALPQVAELVAFLTGADDPVFTERLRREIEPEAAQKPTSRTGGQRVAVIGAGMSGIAAALRAQDDGHLVTIFERNSDFGGTWLVNRYPGCRIDTPNFIYSYSFAQKSDWQDKYSLRDEVLTYFKDVAESRKLEERTEFEAYVTRCTWDEGLQTWRVTWVRNGIEYKDDFEIVVSAVGQLSTPLVPEFAGADDFQGTQVHSGAWPQDLDLEGKRVAVVGSGASGFQIVPAILDSVDSLVLFQRNAPWLLPTPDYHDPLSGATERLLQCIPGLAAWHRFWQFWIAVEGRYPLAQVDPDWDDPLTVSRPNAEFRDQLVEHLAHQFLDRPELLSEVIPSYPPGAKRLLRDNGAWPAALASEKVTIDRGPISGLTKEGIESASGGVHPVDVIIYATGFRASELLSGIEVTGRHGINLHDQWNGEPRAYLGITVPNFPNFFLLYGPNTNLVVNGSLIFMIECALDYVMQCIDEATEKGAAIDTTEIALSEFVRWMNQGNDRSAWGHSSVSSWYKNRNGLVTQNWPYLLTDYWRETRNLAPGAHTFIADPRTSREKIQQIP